MSCTTSRRRVHITTPRRSCRPSPFASPGL
ncbi:hypothetical protein EYF80_060766 [Liparis tanakae]|uniref:Uncharacterized protein n=1 Tax=Liparis tanakae TaxID=230148 RepID=A0A4Z2EJP9_9TELE|nr:hypothetical protein EYF80_060766 [Liparis tanakae]